MVDINSIGSRLETVTFPVNENASVEWLTFVEGTTEQVRPIIEGAAIETGLPLAEIEMVANGVRVAQACSLSFERFNSVMSTFTDDPQALVDLECHLNKWGRD